MYVTVWQVQAAAKSTRTWPHNTPTDIRIRFWAGLATLATRLLTFSKLRRILNISTSAGSRSVGPSGKHGGAGRAAGSGERGAGSRWVGRQREVGNRADSGRRPRMPGVQPKPRPWPHQRWSPSSHCTWPSSRTRAGRWRLRAPLRGQGERRQRRRQTLAGRPGRKQLRPCLQEL